MRRGVREAFANGKRRGDAFSPRDLRQERGTANALVLAEWCGGVGDRELLLNGYRIFIWGDEKFMDIDDGDGDYGGDDDSLFKENK